jgi:hypothetical protein
MTSTPMMRIFGLKALAAIYLHLHARNESAATDRDDDGVHLGAVLDDFESQRALPFNELLISATPCAWFPAEEQSTPRRF